MAPNKKQLEERFRNKVKIGNANECWIWQGASAGRGYGVIRDENSKQEYAHRISYIIKYGTIPIDKVIMHVCDNPICCNPNHLWLGTKSDNNVDKKNKNRAFRPIGSKNVKAKLNEDQVRDIRKIHSNGNISELKLSKVYNVSENTIQRIISGRAWKNCYD